MAGRTVVDPQEDWMSTVTEAVTGRSIRHKLLELQLWGREATDLAENEDEG